MNNATAQRILIVAHGHPDLVPGGGEHVAYNLFKALREDGTVEASFLAWSGAAAFRRGGTPFSAFRGNSGETIFFTPTFDHFLFSQPTDILDQFASYLRNLNPDIIHLHHYSQIGLEFVALARRLVLGVRIVVTLHEYLAICNNQGQMIKTDGRTLCNFASPQDCSGCYPDVAPTEFFLRRLFIDSHFEKIDLFIAPSRFLRQRYIDWGVPPGKIVYLENGTPEFVPPPPRPRVEGEGRGVFAYFGQINPFKGLLDLLKAFDLIAQAPADVNAGVRLLVHGANLEHQRPEFVESVTKAFLRNQGRVLFAGPYQRCDLSRLMANVDWVVVPSIWWENSPLVIEEALAHKRPVICSNIGGMAEKVTPGRDGLHFQVGNPFDLAQTLLQAASNPAIWDKLQVTMRRPLSMANWKDQHIDLYQQVGLTSEVSLAGSA
jgi:glycosyltransferase involved in cell wall biosynthesis